MLVGQQPTHQSAASEALGSGMDTAELAPDVRHPTT